MIEFILVEKLKHNMVMIAPIFLGMSVNVAISLCDIGLITEEDLKKVVLDEIGSFIPEIKM